jgi:vacuolar-type H+-ATPase subunit H
VDVHAKLDELTEVIEGARAMPMSASCIVNRAEVLALLDDLRDLLPSELSEAAGVLRDKEAVVEEGRVEAARLLDEAAAERTRMLSKADVVKEATREAERVLAAARADASRMRADVDDYVDGKLANFEVVLQKTLKAVERGRAKLGGAQQPGAPAPRDEPEFRDSGMADLGAVEDYDDAPLPG